MARKLRFCPEPTVFEVMTRTIHGRPLLCPSREVNELVAGAVGRAQERHPEVSLYALSALSNHVTMLLHTPDASVLAKFMNYVNSNIAREVGRLQDWRERFWGHRYSAIAVLDEGSVWDRFRYVLAQGCKEGLERSPCDWPGVHCARSLTTGEPLNGYWFNRSAEYEARRRGRQFDRYQYATRYEVIFQPLPALQALSIAEQRARCLDLVEQIERDAARERAGRPVLGTAAIIAAHPHERPVEVAKSAAPFAHSLSSRLRRRFREAYEAFRAAVWRATARLRSGEENAEFPPGAFLRPGAFVSPRGDQRVSVSVLGVLAAAAAAPERPRPTVTA